MKKHNRIKMVFIFKYKNGSGAKTQYNRFEGKHNLKSIKTRFFQSLFLQKPWPGQLASS